MPTKQCRKCKEVKPISEFFVWKRNKDGLDPHCKVCKRLFNLASYRKHSIERRAKSKEWADAHKDEIRAYSKKHRELYPEKYKLQATRRKIASYGITLEQYGELLESQGGVCAVCGQPPKIRRLAIDHDHKCCPPEKSCGKCIRGLLCGNCNRFLGHSKESVENLESAIRYLTKFQ